MRDRIEIAPRRNVLRQDPLAERILGTAIIVFVVGVAVVASGSATRADDPDVAKKAGDDARPWKMSIGLNPGYEDRRNKPPDSYDITLDSDGHVKVELRMGLFRDSVLLFQGTIEKEQALELLNAATEYVKQNPIWTEKKHADTRQVGMGIEGRENPARGTRADLVGYTQFAKVIDKLLPAKAGAPTRRTGFINPKWEY